MTTGGREFDLQLHLLDRQVIDLDGNFVCKVDDLELDLDSDGLPYVTAIVVGPRALGPRIGGRLGVWFGAIAGRLAQTEAPPTVDFRNVVDIGHDIRVSAKRAELGVDPLERWVDDHIIARVPGSGHESK
jgi:sporulation protein YlmC with PRC-barrel domain